MLLLGIVKIETVATFFEFRELSSHSIIQSYNNTRPASQNIIRILNFQNQISKQSTQFNSYQLKYQWLARSSEYALLSTAQVQEEHTYLVGELAALKQQLKKCPISVSRVSRVSSKPLHRSHQANIAQNRQRQIENNHYNIIKLKNEFQLLQRQASPRAAQGAEGKVIETKEKILKLKHKIKQIKHRSRQIGDNLENGRDFFQQAKKLEHERDGVLARRNKLQQKIYQSEQNLSRIIEKLAEIQGDALYADSYLEDWLQTKKSKEAEKSIENEYRQKSYQLQLIRKTMESQKSTKQQKYHQLLKNLQTEIEKTEYLDVKMQKIQIKSLYQKKQLIQLEDRLNQIDLNRSRTKTSGSLQNFHENKQHQQLPVLPIRFSKIVNNKRNLSTSRTKTSGHPLENKNNYTQILHKPPSSDSEIHSMISQPPRGYLRTTRNRMIADRTAKTAMGAEKSVQLIPCIQEQIVEQSPDKETIDKNPSGIKKKEKSEQKSDEIQKEKQQKQISENKSQKEKQKEIFSEQETKLMQEKQVSKQKKQISKQQQAQNEEKYNIERSPVQVINEDDIIAQEGKKTIESNIQEHIEKARKSVVQAEAKMQHNQDIINNYLSRFQTDPAEDQQS